MELLAITEYIARNLLFRGVLTIKGLYKPIAPAAAV